MIGCIHVSFKKKKSPSFFSFFSFLSPGGGTLFVLDIVQDSLRPVQAFEFSDGLFDVTWAENNENILVAAGGDGSLQVWDVLQPQVGQSSNPALVFHAC